MFNPANGANMRTLNKQRIKTLILNMTTTQTSSSLLFSARFLLHLFYTLYIVCVDCSYSSNHRELILFPRFVEICFSGPGLQ